MSIESVYHEVKQNVAPSLAAMYMYMRLKDRIVHIDSMAVSFAASDEKNIARMTEKSKEDGFMFFAESEEGKQWIKEHAKDIRDAYVSMVSRFW